MAESNGRSTRLLNSLIGIASTLGVLAFVALLSLWANFQVEQARISYLVVEVHRLRDQLRALEQIVTSLTGH